MKITTELVKHLETLSRLEFDNNETEQFKREFEQTLSYVGQLQEVDTTAVNIEQTLLSADNDLRLDDAKAGLKVQDITKNAPKTMGSSIVVPTVVEE